MVYRTFSATTLQDFIDCKRKFKLKYIDHLSWPAPLSQLNTKYSEAITRGRKFHQLIQQHFIGIPDYELFNSIQDHTVRQWLKNALSFEISSEKQTKKMVEYHVSYINKGVLLTGVIDLLLISPDSGMKIIDWKTGLSKPNLDRYKSRIQTRLYPYLLLQSPAFSANRFEGLKTQEITFNYWFTNFPEHSLSFTYDRQNFNQDDAYFDDLITTITLTPVEEMLMTHNIDLCRSCPFQLYCGRNIQADYFDIQESDDFESEVRLA